MAIKPPLVFIQITASPVIMQGTGTVGMCLLYGLTKDGEIWQFADRVTDHVDEGWIKMSMDDQETHETKRGFKTRLGT